jgi:segregation and condensation protein B
MNRTGNPPMPVPPLRRYTLAMSSTQKAEKAKRDVVAIEVNSPDDAPEVSSGAGTESEPPTASSSPNPRVTNAEEACPDQPLTMRVEAVLISTERPITEGRIAELLGISGKGSAKRIAGAIDELNAAYEQSSRSFRAERLAGGWQLLTLSTLGPVLNRLHMDRQQSRLSQPALESLAIIAYRQPIMRAELEAIRGVASGEVLRGLLERRLVKIVGRAEELGRPMLYGTGLTSPSGDAGKAAPAQSAHGDADSQSIGIAESTEPSTGG